MPYSEFVRQVDDGSVKSVTMATSATGNSAISGKLDSGAAFHTVAPAGSQIADKMIQKGVAVQVKAEEQGSIWLYMLYQSLPFLLILGVGFFVMRQMQKSAGSGAMGFGKSARAADREAGPRDLRRRRRHRRGARGAAGDRRVPEGPGQVRPARRQDPQGRAAGRLARHRQDPARPRHRRRGGRAVLHHLGLGLRRDVRRRRRQPRARHVRAGQEERAVHRLHRRDRRGRPPPRRRPRQRQRRARADAQPAAGRDGRLRGQRRHHHHRRDQPARRARPGACSARAASTARSWCRVPTSTAARRSSAST